MRHPFVDETGRLLSAIRREGRFAAGGRVGFRPPALSVAGVGEIAFPILPVQIAALADAASPAPFGRGPETVYDPQVRSTLQIDAGRIALEGAGWRAMLDGIVEEVATALGAGGALRPELYKLLLYRAGDHFQPHRDSEKAPGMVGTLVMALPTRGAGGRLIVRHAGEEIAFDLASDDPAEIGYAAFYADCVHEVRPVTAGHRVVLTFNLIRADGAPAAPAHDHGAEIMALARHLAAWPDDAPSKLIAPLEHAYTPAEIGFGRLKGLDRSRAEALAAAAEASGVALGAALLTAEESGWAEYVDHPRWRRRGYGAEDEDMFEIVEADEVWVALSGFDGGRSGIELPDGFPAAPEEIVDPDFLENLAEGAASFHEATGNEGVSYERSYARAALVLWPEARTLEMLGTGGASSMAAALSALAADAPQRARLADMLGRLAESWPELEDRSRDDDPGRLTPAVLRALHAIADAHLAGDVLHALARRGDYRAADAAMLIDALALAPPERRGGLLTRLARGAVAWRPEAAAALAARAAAEDLFDAAALAEATAAIAAWLSESARAGEAVPAAMLAPEALADLLTASTAVSAASADAMCRLFLDAPESFEPDRVLLPLARHLVERRSRAAVPSPLRAALLDHLDARILAPLEPPTDWRRPATLPCDCPDCAAFVDFLDDPDAAVFELKAAQARRAHLEQVSRSARADAAYETIRQGSPHRLVIRKTDASHQRRVAQRKQDLADQALLRGAPD